MRVSEITEREICDYLREDGTDNTVIQQVMAMRSAAMVYIMSYTGQSAEYIEEHEAFVPVLLVLVADMYDTRALRVDSDRLNPFVMSVLDLHSVNLI